PPSFLVRYWTNADGPSLDRQLEINRSQIPDGRRCHPGPSRQLPFATITSRASYSIVKPRNSHPASHDLCFIFEAMKKLLLGVPNFCPRGDLPTLVAEANE